MKGVKGRFMKKLKTVKQIGYLNADRILQVSTLNGFVDNINIKSTLVENFPFKSHCKPQCSPQLNSKTQPKPEKPEFINNETHIKDLTEGGKDEEISTTNTFDAKENISPPGCETGVLSSCCQESKKQSDAEIEKTSSSCCKESEDETGSSFRVPDMDSMTLFDPNLLAAFEEAVKEYIARTQAEAEAEAEPTSKKSKYPFFQPEVQSDPLLELDDQINPLLEFEEKCPPGGNDSVIFYTTSLRGIRKTFEDCQCIRFLLESFGLVYYERDVSIHSEFRAELWRVMGEKCLPPRLFIRGRYIGGAEQVLTLNEQGRLRPLFRDIPMNFSDRPCNICCGLRFILCYTCNGSRKLFEFGADDREDGGSWIKCLHCNENGLVVCPLC